MYTRCKFSISLIFSLLNIYFPFYFMCFIVNKIKSVEFTINYSIDTQMALNTCHIQTFQTHFLSKL